MLRAAKEPGTDRTSFRSKGENEARFRSRDPSWCARQERAAALYQRRRLATLPRLMAVPKRKTSKARRDKRRATHAIEAPRVNVCPQCGSPKRAHRICPTCGTYKGREVEPLRLQAP